MQNLQIDVLGLFPAFEVGNAGGIQVSAKIAWDAIQKKSNGQAFLFCYGKESTNNSHNEIADCVFTSSKISAVRTALGRKWAPRVILIWHIGLLKLIPFFRLPDAKVVLFLHGIEAWKKQDFLTRKLLRRVDLFLSNSDYTWKHFLTFYPELKGATQRTVHLGIEGAMRTEEARPVNMPAALMLGRLLRSENYKGHREVIDAWPRVMKNIPEAKLWIAGDGDLRPELERMVQSLGLGESVLFWGRISEEKKQELLLKCRCLAMPSRGEGFGLAYLEAMRVARPCLVSTLDAGRDVVHPPDAGLAVDPDDTEALASSLCELLSDGPEWMALSKRARASYENNFTARHFQQRLVEAIYLSNGQ